MKKSYIFTTLIFISISIYFLLPQNTEKKSLHVITLSGESDRLKAIFAKYSKDNNIKITVEETDFFDYLNTIEEKDDKGIDVPDIFIVINDWIGRLVEKDLIRKISENNISHNIHISQQAVKYKGNFYAYPYAAETLLFYYNNNLVKKYPESIEELIKLSKDIKNNKNIEGLIFPSSESYYLYPWFSYCGGNLEDMITPTENKINNFIKTFKFMKKNMIYSDIFTTDFMFKDQKAAIMLSGNWNIPKVKKYDFDVKYTMINDPKFRQFVGFKSFAIYKKTKNYNESERLLNYLSTYKSQKFLSKENYIIPTNKRVIKESKKDIVKMFSKNIKRFDNMPNSLKIKNFWDICNTSLYRIFRKNENIKKVIREELLKYED
ncbi:MAG: sugar ABC transporter substrate-binding protein [Fusobacteriota bacterium]